MKPNPKKSHPGLQKLAFNRFEYKLSKHETQAEKSYKSRHHSPYRNTSITVNNKLAKQQLLNSKSAEKIKSSQKKLIFLSTFLFQSLLSRFTANTIRNVFNQRSHTRTCSVFTEEGSLDLILPPIGSCFMTTKIEIKHFLLF